MRTTDADEYAADIREPGFAAYGRTAGIRAFAGRTSTDAAVLYPQDERYLIGGESRTAHYDVADQIPDRAR